MMARAGANQVKANIVSEFYNKLAHTWIMELCLDLASCYQLESSLIFLEFQPATCYCEEGFIWTLTVNYAQGFKNLLSIFFAYVVLQLHDWCGSARVNNWVQHSYSGIEELLSFINNPSASSNLPTKYLQLVMMYTVWEIWNQGMK